MKVQSNSPELMSLLAELSEYLSRRDLSPMLLSQYLVMKTLRPLNIGQVFLSQLHPDGVVRTIDSFGVPQEQIQSWNSVSLTDDLPVTSAIRDNNLVWLADSEDWNRDYPHLTEQQTQDSIQTLIIVAIDINSSPAGALGMMSESIVKPSPERVAFVSAVCGLVALFMSTVDSGRFEKIVRGNLGASGQFMSPRQMRILDLMAQELTNPQIAKELGFSESTVRQETMRIYQILQVSGRKEAIHEARRRNIAS